MCVTIVNNKKKKTEVGCGKSRKEMFLESAGGRKRIEKSGILLFQ